ncbi:hypothetical protein [Congregibacter litoralis]|uniref:Uncharacterized protein n=1 Tax=Congregibacter litoralis KT71 TaxID=314285 RepID=A4A3A6_9GAMM|nr:hypothetical protein [Congregibacter litoralis]EAQ99179.1 hypothetical protein KT71_15956 [Congregibacter litoralis KT71]
MIEANFLAEQSKGNFAKLFEAKFQSEVCSWESQKWVYRNSGFSIDFGIFNQAQFSGIEYLRHCNLAAVDFAKLVFTEEIRSFSRPNDDRAALVLTLRYLADSGKKTIRREDLRDFLEFVLTHSVVNDRIRPTRRLKGYVFFKYFLVFLSKLRTITSVLDFPPVVDRELSESLFIQEVKKLVDVLSLGELNFDEWKKGGSLDTLSLDMGRYYVHHCLEYFERNAAFAYAMQKTIASSKEILVKAGISLNHSSVVGYLLTNNHEAISRWASYVPPKGKMSSGREQHVSTLRPLIRSEFESHYRSFSRRFYILSESGVTSVACQLGISDGSRNKLDIETDIDRLRTVIFENSVNSTDSDLSDLLRRFKRPIKLESFQSAVRSVEKAIEQHEIPEWGDVAPSTADPTLKGVQSDAYSFPVSVHAAGITSIVAMLGWRASEFGFPESSLETLPNEDPIDQYASPFRYQVSWHVFKTHGDVKVARELTARARVLIHQIGMFLSSQGDSEPYLFFGYGSRSASKDNFSKQLCSQRVRLRIPLNWRAFVQDYPPFKILRRGFQYIEDYGEDARTALSDFDWESFDLFRKDRLLNLQLHRASNELQRVTLHSRTGANIWPQHYQAYLRGDEHQLSVLDIATLDEHLSEESKLFLKSNELDRELSQELAEELIGDCLYPTPHAFRHMWAEAVYRRFDGDAGWMIRSNFKHISRAMFVAYIQSKDSQRVHETLRGKVVSNLVHGWLVEEGQGYAGKFHKFLSRAVSATTVLNDVSIAESLDGIIPNIVSLSANPWGFCIVRESTDHLSKCASDKKSNTNRASPSLCLGCINYFGKSSNIDYIVFSSQPHMALLQSSKAGDVPEEFLAESRKFLRQALSRIQEMNPQHAIISKYRDVLGDVDRENI